VERVDDKGTWVPFERGVELATQYKVDHVLRPLLEYQPTNESPPLAPKHVSAATPKAPKPAMTTRVRAPKRMGCMIIEC
jgi:transcription factor MBP1